MRRRRNACTHNRIARLMDVFRQLAEHYFLLQSGAGIWKEAMFVEELEAQYQREVSDSHDIAR